MSNFNFKQNISVKDKVKMLIRRYDNIFYYEWNHQKLSFIPLEERPMDSSIPPILQEVRELLLLKEAMNDNGFKLVYFIYIIQLYLYII